MPVNILSAEDIDSGTDRLNKIIAAEPGIFVEFEIVFLPDQEWNNFVTEWLDNNEENIDKRTADYIRNDARGIDQDGVIFIKQSAKKATDFRRLLLHELGHAIGLNHTKRPGDIMNPDYREWYGMTKIPKTSDHEHNIKYVEWNNINLSQDNENFYASTITVDMKFKCQVEGCKLEFSADGELQPNFLEDGEV